MTRLLVLLLVTVALLGCTTPAVPTSTPVPPSPTPIPPSPTLTPLPPTVTPPPTPLPPRETPTRMPVAGTVKSTLNVRDTASLNGKILGVLDKGQSINLIGRTANKEWLAIYYPPEQSNTTGWVIARLVDAGTLDSLLVMNEQGTPEPETTLAALANPTESGTLTPTVTPSGTVTVSASTKPRPTATSTPTASPAKAQGAILFDTFVNGEYRINRVRADGSGFELLFIGGSEPAISAGGRLAFHRRSGELGLWLAVGNLDGSAERIIDKAPNAGGPNWSPDGTRLVYHRTPSGGKTAQVLLATFGLELTQSELGPGVRPAWKPGTTTVMYDGCDADGSNCYSLHSIDTSDLTKGAKLVTHGTNPAYSPGGQQVAYQDTDSSGATNLFVANSDGTEPRQVTKGGGHNALPIWSADGQWLFYRTDQDSAGWAIYAVKVDGSGAYKIADAQVNPAEWSYEKLALGPAY